MTSKEVFESDKSVFRDWDFNTWDRYYKALNKETPVEEVSGDPYYLDLNDGEKICYQNSLEDLRKDRESFPQASYEVRLKDFD